MRPHLEHCIQALGSQHKKDMEEAQRRATRVMGDLEHLYYKERLWTGLVWVGEEKAPRTPHWGLPVLTWGLQEMWGGIMVRGNGFKRKERRFRLVIIRKFFTRSWGTGTAAQKSCGAPSLEALKARLDGVLSSLSWGGAALHTARVGAGWVLRSLCISVILWFSNWGKEIHLNEVFSVSASILHWVILL